MAHSWIQSYPTEYEAFAAYAKYYPDNCTFLIDTYNVLKSGLPNTLKVSKEVLEPMGYRPKGVRIDSGDIAYLSKKIRRILDEEGYPDVKIVASNSLDEFIIQDLLVQLSLIHILISFLTYMRKSSATWSLRLRAVWSFLPVSPMRSVRMRSTFMWIS